MSIATAIQNAQNKIAAAYSKCSSKGATMPATQDLANLANCIDSIQGGGGGTNIIPIDYIGTSGTQHIDTGIVVTTDFKCEMRSIFTGGAAGDTAIGIQSNAQYGLPLGIQSATQVFSQLGGSNAYLFATCDPYALHTFIVTLKGGNLSLSVDGVVDSKAVSGALPGGPLVLFARNKSPLSNYAQMRLYYLKIWNGGTLVRDYTPVRVGQIGYLYDAVTDQLFVNAGAGSFTLGPDKQ